MATILTPRPFRSSFSALPLLLHTLAALPLPRARLIRHRSSRYHPSLSLDNPPPIHHPIAIPPDPKDRLQGWAEWKTSLLRRARTPEEIQLINELSPQEALYIMDAETDEKMQASDQVEITKQMPSNPNYFSGDPVREQGLQDVERVYEQYKHLPKAPRAMWPLRDWEHAGLSHMMLSETVAPDELEDYKGSSKGGSYTMRQIRKMARELNKIHPVLMPPKLKWWLDNVAPLRRPGEAGVRQVRKLDKYERSKGHARRKEAKAKATVLPGEGLVYVNGKPVTEYFSRTKDVENVLWPLQSLSVLGQFNVWVSTFGGGTTGIIQHFCFFFCILCARSDDSGQSEAIKVAVARALLAHDKSGELNEYRRLLRGGMLFPC